MAAVGDSVQAGRDGTQSFVVGPPPFGQGCTKVCYQYFVTFDQS